MPVVEEAGARPETRALASRILEEGFFCGMLGAAVVAAWYLALDSLAGRPLYTPALLGSLLFAHGAAPATTGIQPSLVAWFTSVHALVFLVAGMLAAWMAAQMERFPAFGIAMLFLFVMFWTVFAIFAVAFGKNLLGTLGLWTVAVANLLASAAMVAYLWRRHPSALRNLERIWENQE